MLCSPAIEKVMKIEIAERLIDSMRKENFQTMKAIDIVHFVRKKREQKHILKES